MSVHSVISPADAARIPAALAPAFALVHVQAHAYRDVTGATPSARRAMADARQRTMREARRARIARKESFLRSGL